MPTSKTATTFLPLFTTTDNSSILWPETPADGKLTISTLQKKTATMRSSSCIGQTKEIWRARWSKTLSESPTSVLRTKTRWRTQAFRWILFTTVPPISTKITSFGKITQTSVWTRTTDTITCSTKTANPTANWYCWVPWRERTGRTLPFTIMQK